MAFKETFETVKETEIEIQKFLTYLEENKFYTEKMINEGKLIKAYKKENGIRSRVIFLNNFLNLEEEELKNEIKLFKKGVSAESLKLKCQQIDRWVQSDFAIEDDEDFGEDD